MTREEYIDDILISLGAPIVDVENEELLGKLVDKAFREVRRFIVKATYKTAPYQKVGGIDLSKDRVDSVIQIFRTANPGLVFDPTDVFSMSALSSANGVSAGSTILNDYEYRTQLNQLKATISTDLDFTFDPDTKRLYVNTYFPTPTQLTIVYVPEFKDVSEIKEQYWINYIQRLSLAFAKETLGRIRGKYDLSSSLYKLDGATLVSEGIQERDQIREELVENTDLMFPID